MTILNREMNEALGNLEECAREAPAGCYEEAKAVVELIDEAARELMSSIRALGLKAPGDDSMRNVEVALYAYIRNANPEAYGLMTGEGFGEHMQGPARERVMANCIRDRVFLASVGTIPAQPNDRALATLLGMEWKA